VPWLFEWNWLGYLWAFFVGFPLLFVLGMFVGEVVLMKKTGRGQQGADIVISFMGMGLVSSSFLLGVLTVFVWDFKTALWLGGGGLALLALILAIAFLAMRLIAARRFD